MQDVNDGSFPMSSSADQKKCCLFISRIALNITNAVFKWTSQAHIWPQDKDKDSRRWDKSHVSCISPPGIICQYVYVLFVRIDLAYFSVWQFFNNTWIHTLIAEHFPLHTWRVKSVRCSYEIPTLLSLYEFLWVNLSAFLPRLVWQVRALTPNSGSMKSLRWWGLVICLGPFLRAPQCCLGRVTVQCEVTAEQSQRLKGIKGRELLN